MCPRHGEQVDKEGPELNTVIRTFASEAEAHVAQAVLDANGIDSFLIRDDANGMMPWLQWLHPIRLVVREEDSGDAADLLDTPPGPTLTQ
jgi:putative signal transducing protein